MIEELTGLARELREAGACGETLALSDDEPAFYAMSAGGGPPSFSRFIIGALTLRRPRHVTTYSTRTTTIHPTETTAIPGTGTATAYGAGTTAVHQIPTTVTYQIRTTAAEWNRATLSHRPYRT